jgi:ribosome biogenesis GTPase / thiamine phosphate phosphatase
MLDLATLGWGPFFSAQLTEVELLALVPGRAVADRGPRLCARFADGERLVVVPGRLRAAGAAPVVGDFVLCRPAPQGEEREVVRVLERRSCLSRGAAGRATAEQVLAANVDVVLVVQGLDAGVAPRRLERTLAAVHRSGATPAVVLTKADLCPYPAAAGEEARAIAAGVPVLVVSGATGAGIEAVRALLPPGTTGALLGVSGAGKSTLLNALLGEPRRGTAPVRAGDRRGRHFTTDRELVALPGGGLLVDGPGIRELKLWDGEGLAAAFAEVAALAAGCRFRDCRHRGEPGCEVAAAVERGELPFERLASLWKLEEEAARTEALRRLGAARVERKRGMAIARGQRQIRRMRGRE